MGLRLEETDRDRTTGTFDETDTVLTAAGGYGSRCRTLGPILIEVYSYCKGKDCKKHTLHKVTQCEFPETTEEYHVGWATKVLTFRRQGWQGLPVRPG